MLSVGILTYTLTGEHKAMTERAINSVKRYADELIVVENGGKEDYDVPTFIRHRENQGFTKGANTILRAATHEYIAVMSNDTHLVSGDIHNLCVPDTVTSPAVENQPIITGMAGSFFVIPRSVIMKIGCLDEGMKIYYSDTEYIDRLNYHNTPIKRIDSVVIHHEQAKTVTFTGENGNRQSQADKAVYNLIIQSYATRKEDTS